MRGTNPSRINPSLFARIVSALKRLTTAKKSKARSTQSGGVLSSARQNRGTGEVDFSEAQRLVEEIWSHLSKSEQLRLLDFFSAPKAEVIRAKRELIYRSKKDGPGSDSEKKITVAVSAGRLGK
jgi:hypothetical protein